jgi:hypothetical protein
MSLEDTNPIRGVMVISHNERAVGDVKLKALRITLNIDGEPIVSQPVCVRRLDPSDLPFSLSSHRHSYKFSIWLSLSRFIINRA